MKTINDNTQDISLHKASDNYAYEHAPNEYSIRFNSFRAGGNWQQQKDKITIDKLISVLNTCLSCLTLDSDMEEDFEPEITEAKKLLKQIEKEKQ